MGLFCVCFSVGVGHNVVKLDSMACDLQASYWGPLVFRFGAALQPIHP